MTRMSEAAVVRSRRDVIFHRLRGIESRVRHAQRTKDFALTECNRLDSSVSRFERDAKNDEILYRCIPRGRQARQLAAS